jgi:ketosteroid isomerase-like protein
MDDARTEARRSLRHLASAWLEGDWAAVAESCRPTVHWWSPLAPETVSGADEVSTHLDALLRGVPGHVAVTALVVNDDGTRGVVEMVSAGTDHTPPTAVTSVVGLSGGRVTNGRTYVEDTTPLDGGNRL